MSPLLDISDSPDYYSVFVAELEEIRRHKWIESEKADSDIGFEMALVDWANKHRPDWRKHFLVNKKLAS